MSSQAPNIDVNALMRGLVHELRNPLSAILTASSLLQPAQGIDEESAMLIDVVQKESRRMNRILTEFSSFVKPPPSHPEAFDFARLLRDIIAELKSENLLNSHIVVRDELPAVLWAHADMIQTRQALRHVVSNAVEAMERGGQLHFSSLVEDDQVWICIDDSGEGLSDADVERVFQPFFSTKPASTGLGLSIARGLLRASHGDLKLENVGQATENSQAQRHGARVKLHLPHSSNATESALADEEKISA